MLKLRVLFADLGSDIGHAALELVSGAVDTWGGLILVVIVICAIVVRKQGFFGAVATIAITAVFIVVFCIAAHGHFFTPFWTPPWLQ